MNNKVISKIPKKDLYDTYRIFFGTLYSKPRLEILNILRKGPKNVSEIMKATKMSQSHVSHNLNRLRSCGFVACETKGKKRCYHINKKTIEPLLRLIDKHMEKNCFLILRMRKGGVRNGVR